MSDGIHDLIDKIAALENDLGRALALRAEAIQDEIQEKRIEFEAAILRRHKELKQGLFAYITRASLLSLITAPVIYSLIIPLVFLDAFLWIYQSICFPAYRILKVNRRDYLVFDRAYLAYLNPIEKINCAYCSYANGLIAYAREIAGRTEAHWCPIKHARRYLGAHRYYQDFYAYGDADSFRGSHKEPL